MSADAHYCSAIAHFLQPSITKKHKKPLICFLQTVRKAILPVLYGFGFGFLVVFFLLEFFWWKPRSIYCLWKTYSEKGKKCAGGMAVPLWSVTVSDILEEGWKSQGHPAECPGQQREKQRLLIHAGWQLPASVWFNSSNFRNMGHGKLKGTRLKDRATAGQ